MVMWHVMVVIILHESGWNATLCLGLCMPREKMGWIAPMSPRVELRIGNNQMPKACIQEIEGIGCIERDFELL